MTPKESSPNHNNQPAHKYRSLLRWFTNYWRRSNFQKFVIIVASATLVLTSAIFGVGQWYINRHQSEPLVIGATFISSYAIELGVDPKETLHAVITDLGIKDFRLVSYWNSHEPSPGQYDFSDLDWQFDMIERAGGSISLAIGLRQPRWPECHMPDWAQNLPKEQWSKELNTYLDVVINRYKNRTVLQNYQLENEFLLESFGNCPDHDRQRLIDEFNLVKKLDPSREVIISRSNNWAGLPVGQPRPDQFGISVYKRVWDSTLTKRYLEYPFPSWYYAFLAGAGEIATGKPAILHELQTEAWLPPGFDMPTAPLEELYKSMSPERLSDRVQFAVDSGLRRVDLWGVEWWYQLKANRNAPEIWNNARQILADHR